MLRDEDHLKELLRGGKTVVIDKASGTYLEALKLGAETFELPDADEAYAALVRQRQATSSL
jgi:hypothetical protein